jgi:hypothetical protein
MLDFLDISFYSSFQNSIDPASPSYHTHTTGIYIHFFLRPDLGYLEFNVMFRAFIPAFHLFEKKIEDFPLFFFFFFFFFFFSVHRSDRFWVRACILGFLALRLCNGFRSGFFSLISMWPLGFVDFWEEKRGKMFFESFYRFFSFFFGLVGWSCF